jgi:pantoate--beta-alanine ligase
MARDLNLDAEIRVEPIVREPDGLAMSSRNAYLNADDRRAATALSRGLAAAAAAIESGERNVSVLVENVRSVLEGEKAIMWNW